jgi:hypothetical protein
MDKKILSKKQLIDGIQTTIMLSNHDKSNITTDDIKEIINHMAVGGTKIMVRALNIERWMTLKGMNNDFDVDGFVDYYKNKVAEADVHKFTEFKQVQITVFKPKK